MDTPQTQALAVKLLARRAAPPTIAYYLQQNWKRHATFILLYAALVLALFYLHQLLLAWLVLAFAVGRQTRDVQWYRALARDWPWTSQFLDWHKIETCAQSPVQEASP
jgi:hypothetical protein